MEVDIESAALAITLTELVGSKKNDEGCEEEKKHIQIETHAIQQSKRQQTQPKMTTEMNIVREIFSVRYVHTGETINWGRQ